jgi:hypothetical protein
VATDSLPQSAEPEIQPKPAKVASDSLPQSAEPPEIQPIPAKVASDSATSSGPGGLGDSALSQHHAQSAAARSRSNCEVHRAFIDASKGRNAVAIYQDLVEHHGYAGAYNAVKRFVGKSRSHDPKISCRFESLVGADYVEFRVMLSIADEAACRADFSVFPHWPTSHNS